MSKISFFNFLGSRPNILFGLNFTDAKFGQYHPLSRGQTLKN